MINNGDTNEERARIRYKWFSYFIHPSIFFGIILFFFGDDIKSYVSGFGGAQTIGVTFITIGFTAYTFIKGRDEREKRPKVKWYYYTVTLLLSFVVLGVLAFLYLPFKFVIIIQPFIIIIMILVYYVILSELITKTINNLYNNFKEINSEVEKVTIIIGFFGVLISILTLIK